MDISTADELSAAIAIADALKCPLRLTVSLHAPPVKEAALASKDEEKEARKLKKEAEKEEKKRIKQAAKQAARAAEKEEEREFIRQVLFHHLVFSSWARSVLTGLLFGARGGGKSLLLLRKNLVGLQIHTYLLTTVHKYMHALFYSPLCVSTANVSGFVYTKIKFRKILMRAPCLQALSMAQAASSLGTSFSSSPSQSVTSSSFQTQCTPESVRTNRRPQIDSWTAF